MFMKTNNYVKPRPLFTDGWNSFWHVFFGFLSFRFNIIMPIFIVYQLVHLFDDNLFVDLSEFFVGSLGIYIIISVIKYNMQMKEYLQNYHDDKRLLENHLNHSIEKI